MNMKPGKTNGRFALRRSPVAVFVAVGSLLVAGCLSTQPQRTAAEHAQELSSAQERKMTLGVVQSSIREGMPQSEVAEALGSPNIVTTDGDGNETWIYDKIATETSRSASSRTNNASVGAGGAAGILTDLIGAVVGVRGSQSTGASDSAGATSQTQRTLTVVIKFDEERLVKSVKYQSSSF